MKHSALRFTYSVCKFVSFSNTPSVRDVIWFEYKYLCKYTNKSIVNDVNTAFLLIVIKRSSVFVEELSADTCAM